MEAYAREWCPYEDHVLSFDACISDIVHTVNHTRFDVDQYKVRLYNAAILPAMIEELGTKRIATPRECEQRKLNFSGSLVCDVAINDDVYTRVKLGKIPLMVGSPYAMETLDASVEDALGGYFILHGSQKSIIPQERLVSNHFLCINGKYAPKAVEYRAQKTHELKVHAIAVYQKQGTVYAETKTYRAFPLGAFCIQGLHEDPRRVASEIGGDPGPPWELAFDPKHILPHIQSDHETFLTLCHMVKTLQYFESGTLLDSDRDHYMYKRIDWSGTLVSGLFRQIWSRFTRDALKILSKPDLNRVTPNTLFRSSMITNALKYSISTGCWGVNSMFRSGVSQLLVRLNHAAAVAQLRRINSPTGKEGTAIAPRMVHGSCYGRVCVFETPEGQNTGLHKSLALGARSSETTHELAVLQIIWTLPYGGLSDTHPILVFINGVPRASTSDPERLVNLLRSHRRSCNLAYDVSMTLEQNPQCVWILTDRGRIVRPLWIGSTPPERPGERSWWEWLESGRLEYLDAFEERKALVFAPSAREPHPDPDVPYTHHEVDPNFVLGLAVAEIPFANHNQAPRNVYQTSQKRQALAIPSWDHRTRLDTTSHELWYPQRPLVQTEAERTLGCPLGYLGENAMVAFACYGGWNQEDSVLINQAAIDRGMFRATTYYTHTEELRGDDEFRMPKRRAHHADYNALDEDGLPRIGHALTSENVVVGKTNRIGDRDLSVTYKHDEGRVHRVVLTVNEDPKPVAHVQTRRTRVPEIGDKMCSRAAQKGTIGLVVPQEDLPFTSDGIVPDLIINPHCLPSRMTIGQVLEMMVGKAALVQGRPRADGTSFRTPGETVLRCAMEDLRKGGFPSHGSETMMHGATGEPMDAMIFLAPCYYMRLKHMVADKVHARARGPLQGLTRQPTENRSKNAGLRLGDMECAAMIAHGTSDVLLERLVKASDAYEMKLCRRCGLTSPLDMCNMCHQSDRVDVVEMPYSLKLLYQELQAVGIDVRIH